MTNDSLTTLYVTMLGDAEFRIDGKTLSVSANRSRKLWSVIFYLIINRGRSVSRSELLETFWTDESSTNPISALKTLLYRARSLLEPLFDSDTDPIIAKRGTYEWNSKITCEVDSEQFVAICRLAGNEATSAHTRLEHYKRAFELYLGDFLPDLGNQIWMITRSAHYHAIYIDAVKSCAELLELENRYVDISHLCTHAMQIDSLDEGLHTLIIRSLLRQGDDAAALLHYEKTSDMLYRSLGVRPSDEMRALYTEIMDTKKSIEFDLEVIQNSLHEKAALPGAYLCEYGFFQEAYRLEARRAERSGTCVHIALLTMTLPHGGALALDVLNTAMDKLAVVIVSALRRGDVIAKYSSAQFVIMLPAANYEDSTMIITRIVNTFLQKNRTIRIRLSYNIRALDPDERTVPSPSNS